MTPRAPIDHGVGAALEQRLRDQERRRDRLVRSLLLVGGPLAALGTFLLVCGVLPHLAALRSRRAAASCLAAARASDQASDYLACLSDGRGLRVLGHLPLRGHEAREAAAALEWRVGTDLIFAPATLLPRADHEDQALVHVVEGARLGAPERVGLPRLLVQLGRDRQAAATTDVATLSQPGSREYVLIGALRAGDLAAAERLSRTGPPASSDADRERHALLACLTGVVPRGVRPIVAAACFAHLGREGDAVRLLDGDRSADAAFLAFEIALRGSDLAQARRAVTDVAAAGDPARAMIAAAELAVAEGNARTLREIFAPRSVASPRPPDLFAPAIFPEAIADTGLYPALDPELLAPVVSALERLSSETAPAIRQTRMPVASNGGLRIVASFLALRLAVAEVQIGDLPAADAAVTAAGRDYPDSFQPALLSAVLSLLEGDPDAASRRLRGLVVRLDAGSDDPAMPAAVRELLALVSLEEGDPAGAQRLALAAQQRFTALGGDELAEATSADALVSLTRLATGAPLSPPGSIPRAPGGLNAWLDDALTEAWRGDRLDAALHLSEAPASGTSPSSARIAHDALVLLTRSPADGSLAAEQSTLAPLPFRARIVHLLSRAGDAGTSGDEVRSREALAATAAWAALWKQRPADRALLDLLTF